VSIEDKVAAAMARLGLTPDGEDDDGGDPSVKSSDESGGDMDATTTMESSTPSSTPTNTSTNESSSLGASPPPSIPASPVELPPPPPVVVTQEPPPAPQDGGDDDVVVEDIETTIHRISKEMNIDESIVTAALGATLDAGDANNGDGSINEEAARKMIQIEIDAIESVEEDCEEVKILSSEGHSPQLARRALAFASLNLPLARTILQADEEDAQAERDAQTAANAEAAAKNAALRRKREGEERRKLEQSMGSVTVEKGFDPVADAMKGGVGDVKEVAMGLGTPTAPPVAPPPAAPPADTGIPGGGPRPAKAEDVVFAATSANIISLVLESPVPVLLDVYADWCGPCKQLTPALTEMAIRGGGLFRLVTLDTDAERTLSTALEVKSLPTVFAVRDGRIVNKFEGMPRSEEFVKSFMIGLMTGVVDGMEEEEEEKFKVLSNTFYKVAGAAGFSFKERETLIDRTVRRLDAVVKTEGMATAGESAKVLRSLLSNVIRDPFDTRFKRINLENKVIAAKVAAYPHAVAVLKSVGFGREDGTPQGTLLLGVGKNVVNVAPLTVVRDTIDKWVNKNVREIAAAERKRRDEMARDKLLAEAEEVESDDEEDEEAMLPKVDPNLCQLKVRMEGKNKIHDLTLQATDSLESILTSIPGVTVPEEEKDNVRITCTARRVMVKSTDVEEMTKSLREHRLTPAASVVIQIGTKKKASSSEESTDVEDGGEKSNSSSLQERAAARKSKKKGEHTMQSVGIYSKDDNAKGELIDGGGGTWFEHDMSDEEEKEEDDVDTSSTNGDNGKKVDNTGDNED